RLAAGLNREVEALSERKVKRSSRQESCYPMTRYEAQTISQIPLTVPTTDGSSPMGATLLPGGANFSIFSRSAARIELLFFDRAEHASPSRVIPIDPVANRTYYYGHVFVPGVEAGQIYGFRAYGP